MKKIHVLLALAALSFGCSVSLAARRPVGTEVLVAADAMVVPDGFRPTPGKPIYYILSQASVSLGETISGVKMPASDLIERTVVEELAKQGFVRTQVGGPMPSLFILATWGASNFSSTPDDPDLAMYRNMVTPGMLRHIPEDQVASVSFVRSDDGQVEEGTAKNLAVESFALDYRYRNSLRSRDQSKVEVLMGTEKMIAANAINTPDGTKVAAASNEDRLYISLSAFDAVLFAKKEKRLFWRTSMSVGWRNDFAATLPAMLSSGGHFFGVDVKVPTFLDERDRRDFNVQIGDTNVVTPTEPGSPGGTRRK